ncbi:lipase 1-like [Thrips palmi]|uniref:Lipase 1-like n=1 Tax=Thrips palmi TaxID=161013 RepID=A0A6P8Y9E1_THRPL|nr:lipase 1-like [Thrips palmi]
MSLTPSLSWSFPYRCERDSEGNDYLGVREVEGPRQIQRVVETDAALAEPGRKSQSRAQCHSPSRQCPVGQNAAKQHPAHGLQSEGTDTLKLSKAGCLKMSCWWTTGVLAVLASCFPASASLSKPSIGKVVASWGYNLDALDVATPDGYILTVHRLSAPKARNASGHFTPILIGHGLLGNSEQWLLRSDQNLAVQLVDRGFDVWLSNFRGTSYGLRHKSLSIKSHKFWDFSWHENGVIDQAAMVDFVLQTTGRPRLLSLSYSMSCTSTMVLLSERPEYNSKIMGNVFFAPSAFFRHPAGLWLFTKSAIDKCPGLIKDATARYIINDKMPFSDVPVDTLCYAAQSSNELQPVCKIFTEFAAGKPKPPISSKMMRALLSRFPAGASIRQVTHYAQSLMSAGSFRKYDFGMAKNEKLYSSPVPPSYNLSAISSPIHFFYGLGDLTVSAEDAAALSSEIPSVVSVHKVPRFNHLDFVLAKNVDEAVNKKVIDHFLSYV